MKISLNTSDFAVQFAIPQVGLHDISCIHFARFIRSSVSKLGIHQKQILLILGS